jgi:quinol monooxygenase YgiN
MAFVCLATWTVKDGHLDAVLDALRQVAPPSRAEPGVRLYQPYRDPARPDVLHLFEVYDDEAAFASHVESAHFQKWVIGTVVPLLDDRVRVFYETIDA